MGKILLLTALIFTSHSFATSLNYLMTSRTKLNLRCAKDLSNYTNDTSFTLGIQKLDEGMQTQRNACGLAYYYTPTDYNEDYGIRFFQKNTGVGQLQFMPGRRSKDFDICNYEVLNRNKNPMYLTMVVTDVLLQENFQGLKSAKAMVLVQKKNKNTGELTTILAEDYYCEEEYLIVKYPLMNN